MNEKHRGAAVGVLTCWKAFDIDHDTAGRSTPLTFVFHATRQHLWSARIDTTLALSIAFMSHLLDPFGWSSPALDARAHTIESSGASIIIFSERTMGNRDVALR